MARITNTANHVTFADSCEIVIAISESLAILEIDTTTNNQQPTDTTMTRGTPQYIGYSADDLREMYAEARHMLYATLLASDTAAAKRWAKIAREIGVTLHHLDREGKP